MADEATGRDRLFTRISRVRVTAQSLLASLQKLSAAAQQTGGQTGSSVAESALRKAVTRWQAAIDTADLETQCKELEAELNGGEDLHAYAEAAWAALDGASRLLDRWPEKGKPCEGCLDPAAIAADAEESTAILRRIVYECSKVTVIDEIKERLTTLRVGKALDFHTLFKATLPNLAQRKALLEELKDRKFGGWVEVSTGLIYRLPGSRMGMVLACIAPLLAGLLAGAALYGFSSLDLPPDWGELRNGGLLLGVYGLVMLGVVAQLLIENVKQSLSGSVRILAITDTTYWLALRWVGLSQTVIAAVIVTIGLRLAKVEGSGEGLALCIAAGYSVDSVAGIFLTRFHSKAVSDLEVLNETLGVDETPAGEPQATAPA
ncbi:MAG TPA: hypothetical protein VFC52_01370 [Solirubrobacterales bacterium]|nr:hypothetical protein [Solirubrobacterales bacterium]